MATIIGIFLVITCFMIILIIGVGSSYKNGVRDGYQNTWLPHVQNQIREEQLQQGEKVEL